MAPWPAPRAAWEFAWETTSIGMKPAHSRYVLILAGLLAVATAVSAVSPFDRADWILENVLVIVFVVGLAATYRRFPFSRTSYTLIFLFLSLHEVGAHYTYAEVPYDAWTEALFGRSFNDMVGWERNHFDRLVHFSYGLLLAYPLREVFVRVADVRGFLGYFLPLDLTMSTSMIYELLEWGAAEVFGGDLGIAYLGTQGDVWDAHKDMLLASLGAALAMAVAMWIDRAFRRDFARDWAAHPNSGRRRF